MSFTAIDFQEFLEMYKRLFVLCKSSISGDIRDFTLNSPRPVSEEFNMFSHNKVPKKVKLKW